MPDIIDKVPNFGNGETDPPSQEVELNYSSIELPTTPLYPREFAIAKHGIGGDIIGVIVLPPAEGSIDGKQIAVVDYGNATPENPIPVFYIEGKPYKFFGVARTRYGLFSINYAPTTHISTYQELKEGGTTLGIDHNYASWVLGLESTEDNTAAIDEEHVTITVTREGTISITDHSEQGTTVKTTVLLQQEDDPERTLSREEIEALRKRLAEG